jgi:hypothetical protein
MSANVYIHRCGFAEHDSWVVMMQHLYVSSLLFILYNGLITSLVTLVTKKFVYFTLHKRVCIQ